jgi:hypothetical protein
VDGAIVQFKGYDALVFQLLYERSLGAASTLKP